MKPLYINTYRSNFGKNNENNVETLIKFKDLEILRLKDEIDNLQNENKILIERIIIIERQNNIDETIEKLEKSIKRNINEMTSFSIKINYDNNELLVNEITNFKEKSCKRH